MNNVFFYSINVNDRVRFPVLGELKKESIPSDTFSMEVDTTILEEDLNKDTQQIDGKIDEEDSYFGAFKQTNEKGLYCDEILNILEGFFKRVRVGAKPWRSLQSFLDSFSNYFHNHSNEFRQLMDTMNTKRLITPYIELDLPVSIIEEFNQLDQDDPRIHLYQLNPVWGPAIKEFGFFWERYESTKEVLCLFIWSTIDQAVVPMPAVGLNPYPLCWVCDKGFGTLACTRCHVAKYCCKECQQKDWIRHGGPVCDMMASCLRRVKKLSFKRPPSPPSSPIPSSTFSSSTSASTSTSSSLLPPATNGSKNSRSNKKKKSTASQNLNHSNSHNHSNNHSNNSHSSNSSNCSNSSVSSSPATSPSPSLSPSSSPPPSPPSFSTFSSSPPLLETDPPFTITHMECI